MSERARALEQARETALRTDATYLSPSGRIVRVQGHRLTGQILVDSRGRVAVRNIDTDRLSYVHESDLRELAVDPPPSGASSQAETVAKLLLAARQVASFARAWEPLSPGDIRDLTKAIEAMDALPAPVSPVEPTGASPFRLTDWIPTAGCDCEKCTAQREAEPPTGASPQAETRRDCTCLGTCRGAEGLGPRWKCALETPGPVSPVEPPSEDEDDDAPPLAVVAVDGAHSGRRA